MQAVGDWAERRGIAYSGYTDLAAKPQVCELIGECIEQVNADLARDPRLAGSQIHRFVILHKELDADDGELTRTRKVRRGFIGEKYAAIVEALYSGARALRGRGAGALRGRPHRQRARRPEGARREDLRARRGEGAPHEPDDAEPQAPPGARSATVILAVDDVSLAFGGVKALSDVSFDVREHEIRAIIGPNGAGKSSMLNVINGVYQPQQGSITFRGETHARTWSRTTPRAWASRAPSRASRSSRA